MNTVKEHLETVYIQWLDHCAIEGWHSLEAAQNLKPLLMETVGWLVVETDEYIVVAQTTSGIKLGTSICIIKATIVDMYKVSFDEE